MNKREYQRAIHDTRRAIYKGNLTGAAVGLLRAFIAHNDPYEAPAPRALNPKPRARKLGAKKRTAAR